MALVRAALLGALAREALTLASDVEGSDWGFAMRLAGNNLFRFAIIARRDADSPDDRTRERAQRAAMRIAERAEYVEECDS